MSNIYIHTSHSSTNLVVENYNSLFHVLNIGIFAD